MAPIKTRKTISLDTKIKIIEERKKGCSGRAVALQFNLPRSTVATIWATRNKIEQHVSMAEIPQLCLKSSYVRTATYVTVDAACHAWMQQQHAMGAPISGPLLQEKALMYAQELYPDSYHKFKASNGWLSRFKARHSFKSVSLQDEPNESLSARTCTVNCELKQPNIIEVEKVTTDQLFNTQNNDEEKCEDVKPEKAFEAAETLMVWLQQLGNVDPLHHLLVRRWRDQASSMRFSSSLNQKQICTFFSSST